MGSIYPLWIEKIFFLGLVTVAIYFGILLADYTSGVQLWVARICLLPILVLVLTEGIGRLIQSISTK